MMPDREKVIKAVEEAFDMYKSEYDGTSFFDEKEWAENKRDALALLKELEAVVHCHDCKHSEHWYGDKRRCFMWHEDGIDVFEDGFCNYGKRQEGR